MVTREEKGEIQPKALRALATKIVNLTEGELVDKIFEACMARYPARVTLILVEELAHKLRERADRAREE